MKRKYLKDRLHDYYYMNKEGKNSRPPFLGKWSLPPSDYKNCVHFKIAT